MYRNKSAQRNMKTLASVLFLTKLSARTSSSSPPPKELRAKPRWKINYLWAGAREPILSNSSPLTPTLSPLGRGEGVFWARVSSCAVLLLGAAALPALAADLALTIYNQSFAVVRDTVALDLKPGVNEVRFTGATAHLEPDSVILRDPAGNRSEEHTS